MDNVVRVNEEISFNFTAAKALRTRQFVSFKSKGNLGSLFTSERIED